jgi:hypothetical protein
MPKNTALDTEREIDSVELTIGTPEHEKTSDISEIEMLMHPRLLSALPDDVADLA